MISPKVYIPVALAIIAAVALWQLTGDKTFLVSILVTLAAGGAGVAVKPAPEVSQGEINELSRKRVRVKQETLGPPSS